MLLTWTLATLISVVTLLYVTVRFLLQRSTRASSSAPPSLAARRPPPAGQEDVLAGEWLDLGGRETVLVGRSKVTECSFPKTLKTALPSFSIPLVHSWIRAGVAAISAMSRISPG